MGYSKTPIFLAIISYFNEIFAKCGQKRSKVGKISKEEVKFTTKSLPVVKFISKGTISSRGNAGEKQNLHHTC